MAKVSILMLWRLCATFAVLVLAANVSASRNNTTNFKERCLSFKPETHTINPKSGVKVNVLEYIAAGQNVAFPDNDASCGRASQAVSVDVCRVALSVPTSKKSKIVYELWLPETWNGRTLATGNGGVDGCMLPTCLV